jgi:hypothetical protein
VGLIPGHRDAQVDEATATARFQVLWREPEDDDAVTARYHDDIPTAATINDSRDSRG